MANEVVGKAVQIVEMDLDVLRASQFETVRESDNLLLRDTRLLVQFEGTHGQTTFTDRSIRANVLTGAGGPFISHSTKKFGRGAGFFDGINDVITFPVNNDLLLGGEDFTIEMWFNFTGALGGFYNFINHTDAGFTEYTMALYIVNDGTFFFDLSRDGIGDEITLFGVKKFSNLLNTGWHHIAIVRHLNTLYMFIDGEFETSEEFVGEVHAGTTGYAIGALDDGSSGFVGHLDEIALTIGEAKWTEDFTPPTAAYRVPSDTVLLVHADPGDVSGVTNFRDFSAYFRTITTIGNAFMDTSESRFGGGSIALDGVGDALSVPAHVDLNLTDEDFTIDFWFNCTATPLVQQNIAGQSDGGFSVGSSGWFIVRNSATDTIQATAMQGATQNSLLGITPFSTLVNPGWHHCAFVRYGDRFTLYIDGVPEATMNLDGFLNDSAFATGIGRVGEIPGSTFTGWIDEFRIVKGRAAFKGAFTPARRAYTLPKYPPLQWTPAWNPQNIVLSGVEVEEFPSGRGLRITKPVNDGGAQSFIKWDLIQGIHDVSCVGLFRINAPTAVGGATGFIVRGETDVIRGYRLRLENFNAVTLSVLNPSAVQLATEAFTWSPGDDIWVRYDVADIAGGGVQHRAKWWTGERSDEPDSFMLVHEESTATIPSSGSSGYVGITCPGANTYHDNYCGYFRARSIFLNQTETLRYAVPTVYLPTEFNAIPSVMDINHTPVTLSLGEGLGSRAQCNVVFRDHLHADLGEFYNSGSYWGRFRGREIWRRGQPLRVKNGLLVHDIDDYEVRHLFLESFNGPTADDRMTMLAQDALKFADSDKAQAPALNNGFLAAAITNVQTTAQLLPTGIGDQEYPTSGYLAFGGEEIVSFTRSGDSLVIARAQFGTTAQAHDAEDRVQLCLYYDAQKASRIIQDLLVTYAGVDSALIDIDTWDLEVDTYLQRQYTRLIAEPTGVKKLLVELIQQAGLILWNDTVENQMRLQVLRGVNTSAFEFNEENIISDTIRVEEQRNKLITEAWVYYGVRNPLESLDEPNNYRSALAVPNLEASTLNGQAVIKKIFGTWIPTFARDTAERVTDLLLSRYSTPPRKVQFAVPRHAGFDVPVEAGGYQFKYRGSQDELGGNVTMPIQITRVEPKAESVSVEAEEMLFVAFSEDDLVNRVITVDANINGFNLKTVHDDIYPVITDEDVAASPPVTLTCIVNAGVIVGGIAGTPINASGKPSSGNAPAFDVGEGWPAGLRITVQIIGRVQGYGGFGGTSSTSGEGWPGGTALYTRFPIDLDLSSGDAQIWGGGGGGEWQFNGSGFHGGGGGQGTPGGIGGPFGGSSGVSGGNGTSETRGASGSNGGEGGTPDPSSDGDGGAAGQDGEGSFLFGGDGFGSGGFAIDGLTFINFLSGYGDIRGAQNN